MNNFDISKEILNYVDHGIQHKYKPTLVVFVSKDCLEVCDHCFRKRLFEDEQYEEDTIASIDKVYNYAKNNKEIRSVLLTGGDSFLADFAYLDEMLEKLNKIEHIESIRFGTRAFILNPELIYNNKIDKILKINKKKSYIIVHPLKAEELRKEHKDIIASFINTTTFKAQIPVLKGVNNNSVNLSKLWSKLNEYRIDPYYCFQCRAVNGNEEFTMTFEETLNVFNGAKLISTGLDKIAKLIMSCDKGKVEIVGSFEDKIILKYHQAKDSINHEKVFLAPKNAIWYAEDKFIY